LRRGMLVTVGVRPLLGLYTRLELLHVSEQLAVCLVKLQLESMDLHLVQMGLGLVRRFVDLQSLLVRPQGIRDRASHGSRVRRAQRMMMRAAVVEGRLMMR
jgi:hypothetical protein